MLSLQHLRKCSCFGWGRVFFFFPVNGMGLCLGGILDRVLIAQGCFATAEQCLYRQGLFCSPPQPARGLGVHKQLGGVSIRTADPN